jgi:hypothetical protein
MIGFTDEHRQKYRIRQHGAMRTDPFGYFIPGSRGHIYVQADDSFGVATIGRRPKLRTMPWLTVTQDGDDGFNAVFPAERLKTVARMIGADRRRHATPSQLAALAAHGVQHRFSSKRTHPAADSTENTTPAV